MYPTFTLLLLVTTLTLSGCAKPSKTLFNESFFKATHNSYSGAERGAIAAQLDAGVRFIELDIHDDDFATHNDFRVGHNQPIHEVDLTPPNPPTVFLRAWLAAINTWSTSHPKHAPITVALDVKDDLSDNAAGAGDLRFLNKQIREVFGGKLYTAAGHRHAWPTTESLRGKIIIVLSGSRPTRQAYLRTIEPSTHEQIAFIEFQKGDEGTLPPERFQFFAALSAPANLPWATEWRTKGKLVRLWRVNTPLPADVSVPPANYPATDAPFADWYNDYAKRLGTVE